ncbi:uncharacterized protein LOC114877800 [Osmia bicornis bicornis]|uniref:uncharacterized protein LOC114877800 n=1 Tax=Osmia bicornis bicornis TaxID=1437191 RepID=UPI001EAF17F4|nr:uncharacterized protein LOC114877800 [Osmia bicornis bicornis]
MLFIDRFVYTRTFHKKLLLLFGFWPSSYPRLQRLQISFFYLLFAISIILQLATIFSSDCNFDCITRVLSLLLPNIIGGTKFIYSHIYKTTVQKLFMRIEIDWEFLKDDEEAIEILREYTRNISMLLICVIAFLCCSFSSGIVLVFIVMSPKEISDDCTEFSSRLLHLERNMYNSLDFMLVIGFTDCVFVIISEISNGFISEHVCGLFRIVGHHLRRASDVNAKLPLNERNDKIRSKIIHAVRVHVRATKLMNTFWNSFGTNYVVILLCGTASISLHMINLMEDVRQALNVGTVMTSVIPMLYMYIYLLIANHFGQRVIDHSVDIFHDAYNSRWYEIPVDIQKLYLFILQRSIKSSAYIIPGAFISSHEFITTIVKVSFSCFTVLCSLQK